MKLFSRKSHGIGGWSDRLVLYAVLCSTKSHLESKSEEESFFGHEAIESIKVLEQAIKFFHGVEGVRYPNGINAQYAPTGPLQEISMANGWDQAFLKLSEEFDRTIYCLSEKS